MRYALQRLLFTIPVLFGVSVLTFLMLQLIPGDPVAAMFVGQGGASAEQLDAIRDDLGLNDSIPVQYVNYMRNLLQGDLGTSIRTKQPVADMIGNNLPSTIKLTVASMVIALVLGILLGVIAAIRRGSVIDSIVMFIGLAGVSMPSFWLGLLLISLFSIRLNWLPIIGGNDLKGLILPATALGFAAAAVIARMVRSSLLDVLSEQYIVTARAKGLNERGVIVKHALRNATIPVLTVVGLQFGSLLAGAVIIEQVFARQGIGRMLVTALQSRDFPVAQGGVLFVATVYVLMNLLVDLMYGVVDPRIRTGK
jgi:peptide/nickel transport system permease protein